jgi:isopentenyl phosphate kinase
VETVKELVLVKLGGSIITDKSKPFTVRPDVLERLASEIHEARKEKEIMLIVGHGGGSFPHTSANEYQVQNGIINERSWEGFAKVQNDAAKLNRIVVEALLAAGERAVSVQPSASCMAKSRRIVSWNMEQISTLLSNDLLPVPYGDVALDLDQGCCIVSTEEILGYLAGELGGARIIMVGKVDGVLDDRGHVIRKITSGSLAEIKKYLNPSDAVDVTGGMILKVERMAELARQGIDSVIINGLKPGHLKRALVGENVEGTLITA